ncbi:hypothetical protein [Reichenbachiella ulvae]|uniref:Uncharacterized protein n=1 Tax=Reichenbachiella ulvae TaxID=2980104 RepID=A0ABT3CPY0_9BACT|nr:hypothetical protein [Reichenbachiella ulvae]MCV9385333.1 hypothetical protein [Reichenbachiella ulvae]
MKYIQLVKASAWYDLIVTAPFALPFTAKLTVELMAQIDQSMNLGGYVPTFEPFHFIFTNLLGSLVIIWSVIRIRHSHAVMGLYDAICRMFFASLMMYYLFLYQATPVIYFFLIPELLWGIAQFWGYFGSDESKRNQGAALQRVI